ncbi:LacI family DNA-binding transcriptional regulator [Ruania halotolerans]|uniref:LacI family DNA-binding transcriptional regulator n=1 Tax=Ruania halotolerans TaxID=2897773 RepID=UPI001E33D213|nr:LacI family DNA-binding transcriptional regulator [Ruania halotolerans]UFU05850.1 LacI family transcriptional regulator [Ruania halotolerans]
MSSRVPTIAEVAREAGVSRATVSRVMNGRSTVDPDLASRVREVAAGLNYSPSRVARGLSLGRTQTVGLLVPDLGNPMFQQVLRGANQAATRAGYRILVADSIEEPHREAELAIEARRRCDALILCSPRMPEDELAQVLASTHPVVLVNREPQGTGAPALSVDYAAGIRDLAEHLIGLGHERLLYLAGPASSASNAARVRSLDAVAAQYPHVCLTRADCGSMIDDGYRALDVVLGSGTTAVLAFNDLVAFGLLGKLNEAGVRVPEDLSVAGFDDIAFAKYATPSLTTMSVPQMDLGRHAWERLHQLLEGEPESPSLHLRPRLVARSSTGPAARRPGGLTTDGDRTPR